ncbi:MAG: hypothetical protein IAG13_16060 [Deltaproteobacteria bacterium]|nr:hypothetical protein [Nannocystaceae bacterium]
MTPLRPDLLALVFAAVSTAAVAWSSGAMQADATLTEACARNEAATYLTSQPRRAELHAQQWQVSDGHDTAWIDARTGQLLEIEFAAR